MASCGHQQQQKQHGGRIKCGQMPDNDTFPNREISPPPPRFSSLKKKQILLSFSGKHELVF